MSERMKKISFGMLPVVLLATFLEKSYCIFMKSSFVEKTVTKIVLRLIRKSILIIKLRFNCGRVKMA